MPKWSMPIVAGLLAALVAAPAHAATVGLEAGRIVFRAAPGEANDVTASYGATPAAGVTFDDIGAPLAAGTGCATNPFGEVTCGGPGPAAVVLRLGDGADQGQVSGPAARGTANFLAGQDGDDRLESREGSDRLEGGAGDDQLVADSGAGPPSPGDVLLGGDGNDRADYEASPAQTLALAPGGGADDGAPGEGDDIGADVENLTGGRTAASTLVGTEGPNALRSFDGTDRLFGAGGDDQLDAGAGEDGLDGGAGNDRLLGGAGNDGLTGGPGLDALFGELATPREGVVGADLIAARDGGPDTVVCGPGPDVAIVDAVDAVSADAAEGCEQVDGRPGGAPATTALASLATRRLRYRKRRIRLRIACSPAGAQCRGRVRVRTLKRLRLQGRRRLVVIAGARYDVAAGEVRAVRLKTGRRGRWALRRMGTRRVRVELLPESGERVLRLRPLRR